jgi:transcriptional regulator with XRE-family HTH domain
MQNAVANGEAIRVARTLRGLSQRELGERVGVPSHRIWRIENREVQPGPDLLAKIWGALTSDPPLKADPQP